MSNMAKLEATIFSEGGESPIKTVLSVLSITPTELAELVQEYNNNGRGMVLVQDDKVIIMRVASEHASMVEQLRIAAREESLSKAGLEVLAVVLYSESASASASEVERVRGVNSGYTLRQLTMRGFLSKTKSATSYMYSPTAELLSFLGVTSTSSLPDIEQVHRQIKDFNISQDENDSTKNEE